MISDRHGLSSLHFFHAMSTGKLFINDDEINIFDIMNYTEGETSPLQQLLGRS